MLKVDYFGPITIYKMGRSIGKYVPYSVHSFLLNNILIDTGTIYAGTEFLSALHEKKISVIINTHHHEDHIGNNRSIQEKYNAKIFIHDDALHYLSNPELINLRFYQRFVWKLPQPSIGERIGNVIEADPYTFQVIPVQGHSRGHICLYEPHEGWLFTGDMFCGIKNIYLRQDEDFNQLLISLKKLATLDVKIVFCSLKGVVENGVRALKNKIEYMNSLQDKVLNLYKKDLSSKKIRKMLLGNEDGMFYLTGGHFSKQNLINSIINGFKK